MFLLNIDLGGGQGSLCTASLVSPRVVITAKHCVCNNGQVLAASSFTLHTGRDQSTARLYSGVQEVRTTPQCDVMQDSDFAILLLPQAGDLSPYRFGEGDDGAAPGVQITGIGYGITDPNHQRGQMPREGALGIKNIGTAQIEQVTAHEILIGELACQGDSGGPIFAPDGRIVGVSSRGTNNQDCRGTSWYTRVSDYSQAIRQAITDTGGDTQGPGPTQPNPNPGVPNPGLPSPTTPTAPTPRVDVDGDGVPDAVDQCPGSPGGTAVWMYGAFIGCASGESPSFDPYGAAGDADLDGIIDALDLCSSTPVYAPVYPSGPFAGCADGQRRDGASADPTGGASGMFECDIGQRVRASAECDGFFDCADASDELDCF